MCFTAPSRQSVQPRNDTCPRRRIARWKRVIESRIDLPRSRLVPGGFPARCSECVRVVRQMLRQSVTRFRHQRPSHFITPLLADIANSDPSFSESAMPPTRCPAVTSGIGSAHEALARGRDHFTMKWSPQSEMPFGLKSVRRPAISGVGIGLEVASTSVGESYATASPHHQWRRSAVDMKREERT